MRTRERLDELERSVDSLMEGVISNSLSISEVIRATTRGGMMGTRDRLNYLEEKVDMLWDSHVGTRATILEKIDVATNPELVRKLARQELGEMEAEAEKRVREIAREEAFKAITEVVDPPVLKPTSVL